MKRKYNFTKKLESIENFFTYLRKYWQTVNSWSSNKKPDKSKANNDLSNVKKFWKAYLIWPGAALVAALAWSGVGDAQRFGSWFERQRQMPYGRMYSLLKANSLGSADIWQYTRDQKWHSCLLMPLHTVYQGTCTLAYAGKSWCQLANDVYGHALFSAHQSFFSFFCIYK